MSMERRARQPFARSPTGDVRFRLTFAKPRRKSPGNWPLHASRSRPPLAVLGSRAVARYKENNMRAILVAACLVSGCGQSNTPMVDLCMPVNRTATITTGAAVGDASIDAYDVSLWPASGDVNIGGTEIAHYPYLSLGGPRGSGTLEIAGTLTQLHVQGDIVTLLNDPRACHPNAYDMQRIDANSPLSDLAHWDMSTPSDFAVRPDMSSIACDARTPMAPDTCPDGMICTLDIDAEHPNGRCVPCGGQLNNCCHSTPCQNGLTCFRCSAFAPDYQSFCVSTNCGQQGQPCCFQQMTCNVAHSWTCNFPNVCSMANGGQGVCLHP